MSDRLGRILVTGGAGFIGTALVSGITGRADAILVIDDLSAGDSGRLAEAGVDVARIDIRDRPSLHGAMRAFRADCIVHLAAIHHIPTCEADPPAALSVNVVGTASLLAAAADAGVGRVVLASSGAVYAWRDGPLAEDAALAPSDVYSIAKAANESQLAHWSRQTGGDGLVARIFNVVGPGDRTGHLVPQLLARIAAAPIRGGAVTVPVGAVAPTRDFVDLRDVVRGIEAMIATPVAEPGGTRTFNIATGEARSVRDVAAAIGEALGLKVELTLSDALARRSDRPSQTGDPERAARELGWRPRHSLADAIGSMLAASAHA